MRPLYAGYASWGFMKDEYAVVVTFGLSLLLINLVDKTVGPVLVPRPAAGRRRPLRARPGDAHRAEGDRGAASRSRSWWAWRSSSSDRCGACRSRRSRRTGSAPRSPASTRRAPPASIFVISGALAALSGALLAPLVNPSPDIGAFPAIKSFVIVVLGGMGSIWGAMIAALIIGVTEAFFSVYISYDYRDAFGLIVLVAVLLLRPQGLLGEKGREL